MHSHDAGTREDERESCETALQWCKLCHPRLKTKNQKQNNHTTVCDAVLKNSPNMRLLGPFLHLTHSLQLLFCASSSYLHTVSYRPLDAARESVAAARDGSAPAAKKNQSGLGSREIDFASPEDFVASEEIASHSNASDREKVLRLLHTDPFTHRPFFTQTLLHTNAFTHTDAFTHEPFYTQLLLHTEAFTHRRFYTQTLLHTDPFIHKRFYTQTLLHTDACTHNWNRNFTSVFDTRTSFCAWRVHPAHLKSQFYLSFWHSNLVLCVKGSSGTLEIAILPQCLTLEPRFVREGFIRHTWNRNFTSVFDTRTSFCAWRVHPAHLKSQFYLSFWHSNLVLCVKGSSGTLEIAILPQCLTLEPRFVREGFIRHTWNRNFTSVFDTRTSFRAKGLTFPLGTLEIAILPQFLTLEPRFVREGFIRHAWNRNFTSVFDTRTSFRA